jgi:hypothetical protein
MNSFTPPRQSALDIHALLSSLIAAARNISYFRAMTSVAGPHYQLSMQRMTSDPMEHFWGAAMHNALMMAVIDWCKVFGSKNNRTHWTNAFPMQMHGKVRADLHRLAGGKDEWVAYRHTLVTFRDKRAAHFDCVMEFWDFVHTTPPLEVALESAICLTEYVSEANHIDFNYVPSQAYVQQLKEIMKEQSRHYRSLVADTIPGLEKAIAANPATCFARDTSE